MRANSIVDVELTSLEPADDHLARMKFHRLPSWNEVFFAVRSVVEKTDGCMVPIGGTTLFVSRDSGKCLLYAGVISTVLSVLVRNTQGLGAGGIAIRSASDEDDYYCLPQGNAKRPTPDDGGYHVWNYLQVDGEPVLIDMSFHWIARNVPDCVGPSDFIVRRQKTLTDQDIYYHQHEEFTRKIVASLGPKNLEHLFRPTLLLLREIVNGEPIRRPSGFLAAFGRLIGRRPPDI